MENFTEADLAAAASASRQLTSRYRGYVEYNDVQQEMYVWLLEHYHKVNEWREQYAETTAQNYLVKALRNAGERYCRAEKAARDGYAPEDEFFYSLRMTSDILTLYLDPDWAEPKAQDIEAQPSGKPIHEGWNLPAMVSDVGRAYEALPTYDRRLLARVYGGGVPGQEIGWLAMEWKCTDSAAYNRVRRILGRLRKELGGPSPWGTDA